MVDDAVLVCRVPNTRWPVSAVSMAMATVSRSRISPTRTMSGSSRRAARSAREKELVWTWTSRWFTRQLMLLWTNSTGSSMVMMWSDRCLLMWSTSAARVVDVPGSFPGPTARGLGGQVELRLRGGVGDRRIARADAHAHRAVVLVHLNVERAAVVRVGEDEALAGGVARADIFRQDFVEHVRD